MELIHNTMLICCCTILSFVNTRLSLLLHMCTRGCVYTHTYTHMMYLEDCENCERSMCEVCVYLNCFCSFLYVIWFSTCHWHNPINKIKKRKDSTWDSNIINIIGTDSIPPTCSFTTKQRLTTSQIKPIYTQDYIQGYIQVHDSLSYQLSKSLTKTLAYIVYQLTTQRTSCAQKLAPLLQSDTYFHLIHQHYQIQTNNIILFAQYFNTIHHTPCLDLLDDDTTTFPCREA